MNRLKTFFSKNPEFVEFHEKFVRMEIWLRAQAMAFYTLIALVPSVGFFFWLLNWLGVTQTWLTEAKKTFLQHLNVVSHSNVEHYFDLFLKALNVENLEGVGVLLLGYSMFNLITKYGAALDLILRVRSADQRRINVSFIKLTVRRAAMMVGLPIVFVTSVFVSHWIRGDSWLRNLLELGQVGFLIFPLSLVAYAFVYSFIYYFIPRRRVYWASAFRAGLVVAPALECTRWGVGVFNVYSVSTHKIYGVFAVVPMTMLWIQLAWAILISGGLLLKAKGKEKTKR